MKNNLILFLIGIMFVSCSNRNEIIELETSAFLLSIDNTGSIVKMLDKDSGNNYLSNDTTAAILSIKVDGEIQKPISAEALDADNLLLLKYPNKNEIKIQYVINEAYLKFELLTATNLENIELVIWGPYPLTIDKVIGETIGVVQGENFAIGLQALNAKTLGGFPWTDNDCMPQINIFNQDDYTDMSEGGGKDYVLYRVEAAKPTKFGSSLQAYCRNRNKERVIKNLNHEYYVSPIYDDGGIINSKIALFGTSKKEILPTIEKIELKEGLPHPMLEGEWGKISKAGNRAYIIYAFSEETIDRAIEITKQSGLKYLYHPGLFKNWGHFDLRKGMFPNGEEGLRKCVAIAEENGITVGTHTLSNFITTDDKYVTPIPDRRLGIVGKSLLTEKISRSQKSITIEESKFFSQYKNNSLKTVRINDELIRYARVSEEKPWKLLDCERGAFGTKKSSHSKDDEVIKLADHPYKVFLTNPELSLEVSKNIAELWNRTGMRFISFDGLEGNRSTGMGNYGEILFALNWYNNLNDELKQNLVTHASRTTHYFWHLYTRMNWGEPWYASFRESQVSYRMKNQAYFQRNLMPGMLGWFQLKPETSIEDIEWMLTRSAAYNAGYAFVVSDKTLEANKHSDKILPLISEWEKVRLADLFSDEHVEKMKDMKTEYTLNTIDESNWDLTEVYSNKFSHTKKTLQPGEPLFSTFNFSNPTENKKVNFIIKAVKCEINSIVLEFDNYKTIKLPINLKENETIKYEGGDKAVVYSPSWEKIKEVDIKESNMKLKKGEHTVTFDCKFKGNEDSEAKLEIRLFGKSEKLSLK